jgi:Spy/CpxP family protein refolding chaperone
MRAIRVLMALALVMTAIPAAAQGGTGGQQGARQGGRQGGGQQMQQRQNEVLFKGITLSEEQKVKVDSIQTATREATMAMMQGGGMQDPATREKAQELRQKSHAEMRKVLTSEQAVIFDKNLAEMPQMGPGARRPPGGR